VGGETTCFLKMLYQREPASDLSVARYSGFIAAKPLIITCRISQNPKYPVIF
jgi:hypothetical protein